MEHSWHPTGLAKTSTRRKPMRAHVKVRTGCRTCRQRRVKCDKPGELCQNCIGRGLQCHFVPAPPQDPGLKPGIDDKKIFSTEHETSAGNVSSVLPLDKMQLEVLCHWIQHTAPSIGFLFGPEGDSCWQTYVTDEALRHGFLLYGIMAVAAKHLALEVNQSKSLALRVAGTAWCGQAVQLYQPVVTKIDEDNSSAAFAYSVLASISTVAELTYFKSSHESDERRSDQPENALQSLLMLLSCMRGVVSVWERCRPWLIQTPLGRFYAERQSKAEECLPVERPALDPDICEALGDLENLCLTQACIGDHYQLSGMVVDVSIIESLRECWQRGGFELFVWIHTARSQLQKAMVGNPVLAGLFLAYWAVALQSLPKHIWWAHRGSRQIVERVSDIVLSYPQPAHILKIIDWLKYRVSIKNEPQLPTI